MCVFAAEIRISRYCSLVFCASNRNYKSKRHDIDFCEGGENEPETKEKAECDHCDLHFDLLKLKRLFLNFQSKGCGLW